MFKLLKTFQIVYEQMNFSKQLPAYISQPAVSNQIKQLEELGCSLFKKWSTRCSPY